MSRRLDQLREEFRHETRVTRRHLALVPDDQFTWRPHARSFTIGQLGGHLAECVRWTEQVFAADGIDIDPATYTPVRPTSTAELLATFDALVARAADAMARCGDVEVVQPWTLSLRGVPRFSRAREAAWRDMSLHHLVHHRGQLTVYLRLLDVPLAETYGPTADSQR